MLIPSLAACAYLLVGEISIPKCHDDRLVIELFAAEPDIVTPTGMTVDDKGNPLVIECHTHFPPPGYDGPKHDRIRRFEDTDGDGKADRITTFWEGSIKTMGIGRHPSNGWTYVATRDTVFRLKDADGDGTAELKEPLVTLTSNDKYPHSGISGFAFDADGDVFFGFGENHAEAFEMKGADGTMLKGIEGGHVYRMKQDGSKLSRVSIGCWNPFHLAFDGHGRLFVVDNDPDSLPPCRLLHIVQGGDYGYKYRNGRKGGHPYTAWNGEFPGTLPMVAGTGEAPSGIYACGAADKLPADYRGDLLVTSWGDHRIERYVLRPRGASVAADRIDLVTGGENFRPVGIAAGGDGCIYISDWVDKSYELHKKGRIWRLRTVKPDDPTKPIALKAAKSAEEIEADKLRAAKEEDSKHTTWKACDSSDPFIAAAGREGLRQLGLIHKPIDMRDMTPGARLAVLLALREADPVFFELSLPSGKDRLPEFLRDTDPAVRLAALKWIGEERIVALRDQLAEVLTAGPVSAQLFAAYLATLEKLDRPPRKDSDEWTSDQYAAAALTDARTPKEAMRWALRSVRPDNPVISGDRIAGWFTGGDPAMRLEAVRTLRESQVPARNGMLFMFAEDPKLSKQLRAEALVGFKPNGANEVSRLVALAVGDDPAISDEALRALRGVTLSDDDRQTLSQFASTSSGQAEQVARVLEPQTKAELPAVNDLDAWQKLLNGPADAEAGERIFFGSRGASCNRCHQVQGRGATVGPDLTTTAKTLSRERLVESILQPSKEIAPQFVPWAIETTDGQSLRGVLLGEGLKAEQHYADAEGKRFTLRPDQIEGRKLLGTSIMPEGLAGQMTLQEFKDLLAFLQR